MAPVDVLSEDSSSSEFMLSSPFKEVFCVGISEGRSEPEGRVDGMADGKLDGIPDPDGKIIDGISEGFVDGKADVEVE
jgi:hypothetical protein